MDEKIQSKLAQANSRLKAGKIGVTIQGINNRLYLVATLPPKPDSPKQGDFQQRIALGVYANPAGIQYAEAEAKKVGGLIAQKRFDWSLYLKPTQKVEVVAVSKVKDWINKFEKDYFSRREETATTRHTYHQEMYAVFRHLPQESALTKEVLMAAIVDRTKPDTRQRKRYVLTLTRLAQFAGIDIDLKPYMGSYNPMKAAPRDIPSDEEIVKWWEIIQDPEWKNFYGILAIWGLRPHEVFHIENYAPPMIEIGAETKTGRHKSWAFHPYWIKQFGLEEMPTLPKVQGKNNVRIGERGAKFFSRIGIPFNPYDLRHAWAVRTLKYGLPDSVASQMMGHSTRIHNDLYHHWMGEKVQQEAYDLVTKNASQDGWRKIPGIGQDSSDTSV